MNQNRVTANSIENKVVGETFTLLPNGRTTVCQLTLQNGFTVEGQSACVDIANYDEALGRKLAREEAIRKCWQLEGYLLAERIFQSTRVVAGE